MCRDRGEARRDKHARWVPSYNMAYPCMKILQPPAPLLAVSKGRTAPAPPLKIDFEAEYNDALRTYSYMCVPIRFGNLTESCAHFNTVR